MNHARMGSIGVLMGGCSSEREISLKSGRAVYEAMRSAGCHVKALDVVVQQENSIVTLLRESQSDVAFIALHGRFGEDGTIQRILENAAMPYTGSGVEASRLAMNKVLSKEIFLKQGIPVPEYVVVSRGKSLQRDVVLERLKGLPVVVKPSQEGSSIGITLVTQEEEFAFAVEKAFRYGDEVIVERYIKGRELTVSILGQAPLPIVEIRPQNSFFDFAAKYKDGKTEYSVPAFLPDDVTTKIQKLAWEAHRALGCRDFSRVDFILEEERTPYVLEVNTIPGFTSTSLFPKAAKAMGVEFSELCLELIRLAYGKKK